MDRALRIAATLGGLLSRVLDLIRKGEPERVSEILPDTLLTEIEYAAGAARARAKFPERDES